MWHRSRLLRGLSIISLNAFLTILIIHVFMTPRPLVHEIDTIGFVREDPPAQAIEQQQTHIADSEKIQPSDDNERNQSRILVQKDGRYVLSNVFIRLNQVYFVTNDPNISFPSLLCATAELPPYFMTSSYCNIKVLSPVQFLQEYQMMDIEKDSILDNALILEGLNSENAYHIIWEAVIPAISILLEDGDLPRDPSEAAQYFQDNNWSIIWMDFDSLTSTLNDNWWKELLPTIRNPTRGPMYLVRRLIIGTNGRCAHYGTSVFGESLFDPFYPNHILQS
jgi:hypothetical protein